MVANRELLCRYFMPEGKQALLRRCLINAIRADWLLEGSLVIYVENLASLDQEGMKDAVSSVLSRGLCSTAIPIWSKKDWKGCEESCAAQGILSLINDSTEHIYPKYKQRIAQKVGTLSHGRSSGHAALEGPGDGHGPAPPAALEDEAPAHGDHVEPQDHHAHDGNEDRRKADEQHSKLLKVAKSVASKKSFEKF